MFIKCELNRLIHWIEIENSIQQGPLPGRERLVDRTVNAIVFFNVLCCEQLFLASTLTTITTLLLYIIRCRYFTPNIPHQKLIVKIDDGFSLLSSFFFQLEFKLLFIIIIIHQHRMSGWEWEKQQQQHHHRRQQQKSRALFYAYYDKFQYKNIISLLFVRHTHTHSACYKMSKFCVWCVRAWIIFIDSNGAKQLTTDYFLFAVDLCVFCFCSFVRIQQNECIQLRVFPFIKIFALALALKNWLLSVRLVETRAAYTSVLIVHIWHKVEYWLLLFDLFTISNDEIEFKHELKTRRRGKCDNCRTFQFV